MVFVATQAVTQFDVFFFPSLVFPSRWMLVTMEMETEQQLEVKPDVIGYPGEGAGQGGGDKGVGLFTK